MAFSFSKSNRYPDRSQQRASRFLRRFGWRGLCFDHNVDTTSDALWNGAGRTFLSCIHIACEAGRQTVEHGAAARRRPQVLMHGEPQAELEIEAVRQRAHQIHLLPASPT